MPARETWNPERVATPLLNTMSRSDDESVTFDGGQGIGEPDDVI
jgi:hypothetical protein